MSRMASLSPALGSRAALLPRAASLQSRKNSRSFMTCAARAKQPSEVTAQQDQGAAVSQQQGSSTLQRQASSGGIAPSADFGELAPTFGRVGNFLRSIEEEMSGMMQALASGNTEALPPEMRDVVVPLKVDIQDKRKEIVIKADVPGMTGADISVELDPETKILTITGEREIDRPAPEDDEDGRGFVRVERKIGRFSRSFKLPDNVDPDNITAKVTKGELEIHVPKTGSDSRKQQKINVQ